MKNKIYLRGKVMEKKLIKCEIRTKNGLNVECELKPDTIIELKYKYKLLLTVFCNENKKYI